MSEKINYLTPVGRMVTGDLFKPNTTNMDGTPLVVKSGPNKGQPSQQFVCGLAFAKNDPAFYEWYCKHIDAPARKAWPQWFNGPINNNDANYKLGPIGQPQCTHPAMSLKIRDGDGIDGVGKPNSAKEGYAGHWVLVASSSFAPGVYYVGQYPPQHKGITDPNLVRRGWFYRMGGTIESNNNPQKPGLYVNLNMVDLCATGQEIVSGPDAATVFGGAPVALPAGAQALPTGGFPAAAGNGVPGTPTAPQAPTSPGGAGSVPPAAGGVPTMPGTPATPGVPPTSTPAVPGGPPVYVAPNPAAMAVPGAALPGLPAAAVAPPVAAAFPPAGWQAHPTAAGYYHNGVEAITGADLRARFPAAPAVPAVPAAPVAPVVPPVAAAPVMTAKAAGATYEQFVANGWTLERMRADGYVV